MATITKSVSFQKDDPIQVELLAWIESQPMGFSPAFRALAIIGMEVQKNGAHQSSVDIGSIVRHELQAMERRLSLTTRDDDSKSIDADEIDDDLRKDLLAF